MQGAYFVNTELQFSPGQLLFSSPTDFMIYSMYNNQGKSILIFSLDSPVMVLFKIPSNVSILWELNQSFLNVNDFSS